MTPWEILGLEQTADESAVKQAYRVQLRKHHPEVDPQGFQRVRQAYEAILNGLQHPQPELVSESLPTSSESPIDPLDDLKRQFARILQDPAKRVMPVCWQTWLEPILWQPIDQQERLSHWAMHQIIVHRWLPGEIVDVLWQGLSWQLLFNHDHSKANLAEFLDEWRKTKLIVSLDKIAALSDAEQRALLSFMMPFQHVLAHGRHDALYAFLNQPTVFRFPKSKELKLSLLKAFNACQTFPRASIRPFIHDLIELSASTLNVTQWEIVGEACVNIHDLDGVVGVAKQLIRLEAYTQAADVLYQVCLPDNPSLALCFAFLKQQWEPLPSIYWRSVEGFFPSSTQLAERRRVNWLFAQLIDQPSDEFSHHLDFMDQNGFLGLMVKTLWATQFGSWVWIEQLAQQLFATLNRCDELEALAVQLTLVWAEPIWEQFPSGSSVAKKLSTYQSDIFLLCEPLTDEEWHSLNASQWIECVNRHPLIPDSWLSRLHAQNIVSRQLCCQPHIFTPFVSKMLYYRLIFPEYRLSESYINQIFEGAFDWMITLFSQPFANGLPISSRLTFLPELPTPQANGPLGLLPDLDADHYSLAQFERFPREISFIALTEQHYDYFVKAHSKQQLFVLAEQGEILALAALAQCLQEQNFDLAVVYWNLFHVAVAQRPLFHSISRQRQHALFGVRHHLELDRDTYHIDKAEFLQSMLTRNSQNFPTLADIEATPPSEEAKFFHMPMAYLLVILHRGIDDQGYSMSPLMAFSKYYHKLPDDYQKTIDIAVGRLQRMYQKTLDKDRKHRGLCAIKFSAVKLKLACLAFAGFWFGVLPTVRMTHPEQPSLFAASVFLLLVFHWMLVRRLCKYIITGRMRIQYRWYSVLTMVGALLMKSVFLSTLNIVGHLWCAYGITKLFVAGGWEKRCVTTGRIDIRAIIGFKPPRNSLFKRGISALLKYLPAVKLKPKAAKGSAP
ncbi:J domain-containing protein [Vibrio sp. AK197]